MTCFVKLITVVIVTTPAEKEKQFLIAVREFLLRIVNQQFGKASAGRFCLASSVLVFSLFYGCIPYHRIRRRVHIPLPGFPKIQLRMRVPDFLKWTIRRIHLRKGEVCAYVVSEIKAKTYLQKEKAR